VDVHCLALILALSHHGVSLRPDLFMEFAVTSFQNKLCYCKVLTLKRGWKDCLYDRILKLRVEHDDFENFLAISVHAHLHESWLDESLVKSLILVAEEEDKTIHLVVHRSIVERGVPKVVLHRNYLLANLAQVN